MIGLDGFGIGGYRSFGREVQRIGPLQKINLVIGQNNSGKSNILRFATEHLRGINDAAANGSVYIVKSIDRPLGAISSRLAFDLGVALSGHRYRQWLERFEGLSSLVDKLMASLSPDGDIVWFSYEENPHGAMLLSERFIQAAINGLEREDWRYLRSKLINISGGDLLIHWVPQVLNRISPVNQPTPEVVMVPAIREVQVANAEDLDFSGKGLINRLAKLQNPGYLEQDRKRSFESINRFLREVTQLESATIEIPAERDTILVHMNGRTLPIQSLGTGIHEVVILAAAATAISDRLVCMEEPEIHLHPILQRKLLSYLQGSTDNQYIIATHSSHFLDQQEASVLHVRLSESASLVRPAITATEKFNVCCDLGYKASDILQTNSIIWVEGPSDRIYLNGWLKKIAPDLVEGNHYSVMFYGGRLLSHLTADDPEVDEFISLRRLNRFLAILIDSDRRHGKDDLNDTKKRIIAEFSEGPGFAWVTAGREIENYVPAADLESAIRHVHKDVKAVTRARRFSQRLAYTDSKGKAKKADKIKVACRVVASAISLGELDLREKVERLARFVSEANKR